MATETGWTTKRPDENGIYWFKQSGMLPEVLLVHGGFVYDFGDKEPTSIGFYDGRGEWSGPLYASDAEQLMELRRVLDSMLDDLRSLSREPSAKQARMKAQMAYNKLRAALQKVEGDSDAE